MGDGQNGKGDAPRNIFSEEYRCNFDGIDWGHEDKTKDDCASKFTQLDKFGDLQETEDE